MIEQFLHGSLLNITPLTMVKIEEDMIGVSSYASCFGCWIAIPPDPKTDTSKIIHKDLLLLVAMARDQGCTWIYLDNEAEPLQGLPTYNTEWSAQPDLGLMLY